MQAQRLSWLEFRPQCRRDRHLSLAQASIAAKPTATSVLRHHRGLTPCANSNPANITTSSRCFVRCAASNRHVAKHSSTNGAGGVEADRQAGAQPPSDGTDAGDNPAGLAGVLDNSTIVSMDWNDWMLSSSGSSTDGGELLLPAGLAAAFSETSNGGDAAADSGAGSRGRASINGGDRITYNSAASAGGADSDTAAAVPAGSIVTVRIAFYAVGASFDRRQLEGRLRATCGSQSVRKYPDVIHCQMARSREAQPGADVFFFDFGVLACWGLTPEAERDLVRDLAVQCAVQPLPSIDHESEIFRCTFTTNPLLAAAADSGPGAAAPAAAAVSMAAAAAAASVANSSAAAATAATSAASRSVAADAAAVAAAAAAALADLDTGAGSGGGSGGGTTTTNRRFTRRGERSSGAAAAGGAPTVPVVPPVVAAVAAAAVPLVAAAAVQPVAAAAAPTAAAAQPPRQAPPAAGPYSVLYFPPQIANDTVLLHVRHCGDTATLLAISYALAQSTKMSVFEKAVGSLVADTSYLPEALAEHGEVHVTGKEIGKLLGKVFLLKRSVNLMSSVATTPEFFWYAPDELQALYTRITEYVELTDRVEQLNGRFAVLQEMLELVSAQEENRHGNRLEWIVIWLIVVEVVLGFFELLELFGVIGPQHGAGGF